MVRSAEPGGGRLDAVIERLTGVLGRMYVYDGAVYIWMDMGRSLRKSREGKHHLQGTEHL